MRKTKSNAILILLIICVICLILTIKYNSINENISVDGYGDEKDYILTNDGSVLLNSKRNHYNRLTWKTSTADFNFTYPLSPIVTKDRNIFSYKLTCVADQDFLSPINTQVGTFQSYRLDGELVVRPCTSPRSCEISPYHIDVIFDDAKAKPMWTSFGYKNRGAELSELVAFNGKLYTCDDRTGIVFEISAQQLYPRVFLSDGDGLTSEKGLKCEWMTVVGKSLLVGGIGKEWTTKQGEFLNNNPKFVSVISSTGHVERIDWHSHYDYVRRQIRCSFPGYFITESVLFSPVRGGWIFLPRRISNESYNDIDDRLKGSNLLIETDLDFKVIRKVHVGDYMKRRGFSTAKFIPGTSETVLIALLTEELSDTEMKTYYTVFTIDGKVIVPQTLLSSSIKFEGIEFS